MGVAVSFFIFYVRVAISIFLAKLSGVSIFCEADRRKSTVTLLVFKASSFGVLLIGFFKRKPSESCQIINQEFFQRKRYSILHCLMPDALVSSHFALVNSYFKPFFNFIFIFQLRELSGSNEQDLEDNIKDLK